LSELLQLILLALLGGLSGFINILAGGGSLLTLPFLIFMGLPVPLANGTNRVAILVQNIPAIFNFHKFDVIPHGAILVTTAPSIVGAIIGAQLAVDIDELLFKRVLAIIMVLVMAFSFSKNKPASPTGHIRISARSKWGLGISFFFVGIYGGFIQAGLGFFIITILTIAGYDLVRTNALKILVVLVYTPFALAIFMFNGQVDWPKGIVLSAGSAVGAWLSSRVAVKKGHNFIRWFVLVTVIVFAIQLFWGD